MRAFVIAAAAATVLGFALTDRAAACSCAPVDPREALATGDAAGSGTIVDDGRPATLRVDEAVSPDGRRAAAISTGLDRRDGDAAVVVARLRGPRRVWQRDVGIFLFEGSVPWLGDDRLLMGGDANALRLFDARARPLRRYRSRFEPILITLAGQRLYGIGTVEGDLLAADPPEYAGRSLGDLPAGGLYNLVAVPGGTTIDKLG